MATTRVREVSLPQSLAVPSAMRAFVEDNPVLRERVYRLSERVVVTVTPRTLSGRRLQDDRGVVWKNELADYEPDRKAVDQTLRTLKKEGFEILRRGRFAITVAAPAETINKLLGLKLIVQRRPRPSSVGSVARMAVEESAPNPAELFVAPPESLTVASPAESADHFVFIPPPLLYDPSAVPPKPSYAHLQADDIRRLLNVPAGATGAGVKVAVVDTGFAMHPYYNGQPVTFHEVAGGPKIGDDAAGHGTAVTLNLLAVAPKASVVVLGYGAAVQDAIETAVDDEKAKVVSCSWGWDHEQSFPVIEASIRSVVEDDGVTVVVATGNGQISWPASMPSVIAVGGVFADPSNGFALEASTYASGFASSLYPGRSVPDVSGLCGQGPRGIYIPMPCPPGCDLDRTLGGGKFPNGDETAADDGWAVGSGTSAATPQIAGVVALLLERAQKKNVALIPAQIRQILQDSAKPVQTGRNALGFPAAGHPNVACGYGLVDAGAAVNLV